ALPKDVRHGHRTRLDVVGACLLALGLFFLVFAVTEGPDQGWAANLGHSLSLGGSRLWPSSWPVSPVPLAAVISMAALAPLLVYERRKAAAGSSALVDLAMFERRSVSAGLVTAATVVMAQAGMMFVLAIFLQATHSLDAVTAGRWLLPVGLAVLAGAQLGGRG